VLAISNRYRRGLTGGKGGTMAKSMYIRILPTQAANPSDKTLFTKIISGN
jgi:hypothetical protein